MVQFIQDFFVTSKESKLSMLHMVSHCYLQVVSIAPATTSFSLLP